jgi:hypothetical protein
MSREGCTTGASSFQCRNVLRLPHSSKRRSPQKKTRCILYIDEAVVHTRLRGKIPINIVPHFYLYLVDFFPSYGITIMARPHHIFVFPSKKTHYAGKYTFIINAKTRTHRMFVTRLDLLYIGNSFSQRIECNFD